MTADDQVTTTWQQFGWGPWTDDSVVPQGPLDEQTRSVRGYPRSLTAIVGEGVVQRPVFEPALKQYGSAMRAGEPQFVTPDVAQRWHSARRHAVDHVLAAVATSRWAGHLVLRGSVLLQAWYGSAAREPGDLDFVVTPATWEMDEPRTERLFEAIARGADALSRAAGDVRIDAAGAISDEIWTYDRVPGRRMILPWQADGLPSGTVQLDFVFNETLPSPPEFTDVPRWDGPTAHRILGATPEQSLAWKLLWLLSDSYPQGKDLYDAVLLAEATPLRAQVLHETLVAAEPHWAGHRITPGAITAVDVDWEEFAKEYPDIATGTPEALVTRLVAALEPVFAEEVGPPVDGYVWRVRHLASHVRAGRRLAASGGMGAVLEWLQTGTVGLAEGIVIIREIVGPDRCTLEEAAAAYVNHRPFKPHDRGFYSRGPEAIERALAAIRKQV
ncbi:nucleotidyl transferase AbiEii/AbiGii toxin family protein [Embleya sp. NBC_00896]|uniref:nucleotidyl transferase AbiEii/AbiGii toxin family protein n=1 Tax=Embleya sp. NBC_00896 TaxID=2975961 RepID=UPI002F9168BE|nr:nucleotidyl transferase AbiEii/AbiGii toxin family protein [Embleya sp. NBC_00896]